MGENHMRRNGSARLSAWLDEAGKGKQVYLEFTLYGNFYPGQAEVRYYPDGSGSPEEPATMEYDSCHVTRVIGACYDYKRSERPDWFHWLDEVVDEIVYQNLDHYEQWLLDDYSEKFEEGEE